MAKSSNKKAATKKAAASSPKKAATSSKKAAASSSSRNGASSRNASSSGRSSSGGSNLSASAGRGSMQMNEKPMLEELFYNSLKDIYWAEKALVKALGKLSKAATSQDLKDAFAEHLAVTNEQVSRLDQIFETIGKRAQGKKCEAMDGLMKEADEMTADTQKGSKTRDVALIMAAQKVEHYEIATYGSLATLAAQMGETEVEALLRETLQEEKDTDVKLTEIAESHVNSEAGGEDERSSQAEEEE